MSRLKVVSGKEAEFKSAWKAREKNSNDVIGFKKFNLIRKNVNNEFSLYIFHSEWNSEDDFINWTKSDSFKFAHKNPTPQRNLYLEPPDFDRYQGSPEFEGFELII